MHSSITFDIAAACMLALASVLLPLMLLPKRRSRRWNGGPRPESDTIRGSGGRSEWWCKESVRREAATPLPMLVPWAQEPCQSPGGPAGARPWSGGRGLRWPR